ncbi:MAG: hypothetical protein HOW73_20620 [Polyangiaceae bacterium]|nr:hypothetical protein [Polyangiaceae bacterium]
MGVGDTFCGELDCGFDADVLTVGVPAKYAQAYRFNPHTRDFDKDADGRLASLHWVDAAMQNALHFHATKIRPVPSQGNKLPDIKFFLGARGLAQTTDAVRLATAWLVNGRHVRIHRVAYEPHGRHASMVLVEYFNLRLDPKKKLTVRI